MRLVFLGPPGSGKGTQAAFVSEALGVPALSTGAMLRQAIRQGSDVGLAAKAMMDAGALVSDEVMVALIMDRVAQPDCANGYVLDGFPRTLPQAHALEVAAIVLDWVVVFAIDDDALVQRISGRRVHPASGRTYHLVHQPPARPGCDDATGEPLIQRDDDLPETVRQRLAIYHAQTQPLVAYYEAVAARSSLRLLTLDASAPVDVVRAEILHALKPITP